MSHADLFEEVEVLAPCPACDGEGKVDSLDEEEKTYNLDENGKPYVDGVWPVRVRCKWCDGTGTILQFQYIPKETT